MDFSFSPKLTSSLLLPTQSFTLVPLQYIQYCIFNVLLAATVMASELEPDNKNYFFSLPIGT